MIYKGLQRSICNVGHSQYMLTVDVIIWHYALSIYLINFLGLNQLSCGKVFTIQEKKLSHFKIQETYGLKALNLVKAAVTRWLFYGTACKHCVEDNILLLRS